MTTDTPERGTSLHVRIMIGLVLGAVCGILTNLYREAFEARVATWWGQPVTIVAPFIQYWIKPVSTVFLNLLLMTVVPLVFCSLAVGVARLGDLGTLGRLGGRTMLYFVLTMALAVVIGLVLVNAVRPGDAITPETQQKLLAEYTKEATSRIDASKSADPETFGIHTFVNIVPRNPLAAAVRLDMLGVIFFALMVGIALTQIERQKSTPIVTFLDGVTDAMVFIIHVAMLLAPYGVFAFLFEATAKFGLELLLSLGWYVGVVLVGLAIQMFVVFPILLLVFARISPLDFFRKVTPVIVTAFSTSSSNATLPTSIQVAEEDLGIPKPIAGFVLPLGATMNMNGTALFEGVTVVFLAQVFGVQLDLTQQIIVICLAVLTAIGAAGVPGGSIPLLALVLTTVKVPPEGIAIILGVDRLLDMCRTTLNVVGDLTAAAYITRIARDGGDLPPESATANGPDQETQVEV